jgi:hypothetical protein
MFSAKMPGIAVGELPCGAIQRAASGRIPRTFFSPGSEKDAAMQRIAATVAFLACALLGDVSSAQIAAVPANSTSLAPPAARGRESELVSGWYRDYLGRDAGQELTAWSELLRGGMPATDVQAAILGSEEFYQQRGYDPETFVRETLQAITWAEPSYSDVQRWTERLRQLRDDRFSLVREILMAGRNAPAGNQAEDTISRLAAATRLAADTIEFELGGTVQGRQAAPQARALQDAVAQLQRQSSYVSSRPDDAIYSLQTADRAYQALHATLSNPSGTAPSAAGIVRRIGTMLGDVRLALRPSNPGPLPPSYPGSGYESQQLLTQVNAARRAAESLIQTLTSQAYQNYSYSVALRDLDTLASRLAGLEQAIRSGASRDRLQWEAQAIDDSAGRVRTQLASSRLPYSPRLYWQSVESNLTLIRESLGVAGGGSTVLRPTALHESLRPFLDQAISHIDVFLAGTDPLIFGIPDVPSVQRDVRNLRSRVLTMRQQADIGEPASALKQTLSGMVGDYQNAFDRWNRIVSQYRLINPARISPVGESLNRVEQLINSALASGELPSAGPTRASQQLALLATEISDARRATAALAGYREQQSIDQYLDQLAGYVQSLGDALARPTTVDAKRLAVGMQRVVGLLQAEINSASQRVGGATAQGLVYRGQRIGRQVDELEAELY